MTMPAISEQVAGTIPVIVTTGVVLKTMEGVFGKPGKETRIVSSKKRKKSKRSRKSNRPL
jgi:hypothetical protein